MGEVKSYRDLIVWQKAMDLAELAINLTRLMPKAEEYRLISQIVRAASSIPANIAEGHKRGTRKDYAHFIAISRGSLAELETLILLAARTEMLAHDQAQSAEARCDELSRMLNVLYQRLT